MRTVRLGKTELHVSGVGFGGIPIMRLDFDHGVQVVRYCYDHGITFFDTANKYGDSELKIGEALKDVRDHVVLASKSQARDAAAMAAHIDLSLERLQTDRIDIYQHHMLGTADLAQVMGPGGAYEALVQAWKQGKIRHLGFSAHNLDGAIEICRSGRFETVQVAFNFIEREPADLLFQLAKEMDMGIIGMKPLGGGLLRYARLCLGFLQQHPEVLPIPGPQSIEEAAEIVDLSQSGVQLTDEDLEEIGRIRRELGSRFCHRCEYCLPCDQGIMISKVLHFRSIAARYAPEDAVRWAGGIMERVTDCIECRECVGRCPYELPIPELLMECLGLYESTKEKIVNDRPGPEKNEDIR